MTYAVMRFSRQLLAAATVMVSTTLGFAGCTSRSASEETDLAEPDIAVVPDIDPGPPRGEIRLVDGLLSSKRLPVGGFRALVDLLGHREKSRSRLYDQAIKELVKVACEYDDPLVGAVIDGSSLAEIYPLDRLHDADAAGCGIFFINGRKQRGALFGNGCFAIRLAAVTTAFANGDAAPLEFEKCPVLTSEPKKSKPVNPPPTSLGSAVPLPVTVPSKNSSSVGPGAGQGSRRISPIGSPRGEGSGVGGGSGDTVVPAAPDAAAGSSTNAQPGNGSGAIGSGSGVSASSPPPRVPPAAGGSAVALSQGF